MLPASLPPSTFLCPHVRIYCLTITWWVPFTQQISAWEACWLSPRGHCWHLAAKTRFCVPSHFTVYWKLDLACVRCKEENCVLMGLYRVWSCSLQGIAVPPAGPGMAGSPGVSRAPHPAFCSNPAQKSRLSARVFPACSHSRIYNMRQQVSLTERTLGGHCTFFHESQMVRKKDVNKIVSRVGWWKTLVC